jgi:hypothetical protein
MEIIGRVAQLLPLVTGQGKNGEWRKQEFIIEIADGQFPKKICFSLWGDKIGQAGLALNETVKVFFDIESREYNARWFTEAKAWKVEKQAAGASAGSPTHTSSPQVPNDAPASFNAAPVEDDLPF